jgi:hypothetical protein
VPAAAGWLVAGLDRGRLPIGYPGDQACRVLREAI